MEDRSDRKDERVTSQEKFFIIADIHTEEESENESVLSCEIIPVPSRPSLAKVVLEDEEIDMAIRELEYAIEEYCIYETIRLEDNIRNVFRSISAGLSAVLCGSITYKLKISKMFPLSSAGRIAVRPFFKRAGYPMCSDDPCLTRTGLPRSISMPANMTDTYYCEGVAKALRRYPNITQP